MDAKVVLLYPVAGVRICISPSSVELLLDVGVVDCG